MKISPHYKLIKEHPASFEMHDARDGRSFHIAKAGMSDHVKGMMQKVQPFAPGSKVQNLDEGGTAAPPASAPAAPVDNGDIHPIDSAAAALTAGGSQGSYDQSMASLPTTPDPGQYDSGPGPAEGAVLASNGPITPDQAATLPGTPAGTAVPGDGAPPTPTDPMSALNAQRGTGLDQLETDLRTAQKTETDANAGIAKANSDYAAATAKLQKPEDIMAKLKAGDDQAKQAFMDAKISPDHYWANKSTGAKISAAIGMMFGGIGAGLTHGPNLAVEAVNKAIERDMEAQRSDQSQAMNLWKMNREATQSDLQANLMTRSQMLTAVEAKTRMFQAQAGNAQTELKFAPLYQNIAQQKFELNTRMGLAAGGMSDINPAKLVPMMVKDPNQQKQVYEEIGRAQNISQNSSKILAAFDAAQKENTVMRTGAGLLREPGSLNALHQLLLPNFKTIDGTVRQAAMDETFHNVDPRPGDFDAKGATRRQALVDWMHSESSAPTAMGNGLDLGKFSSTAPNMGAQPQTQKMGGVPYVKVPGGWKKAQ